MHLTPSKHSPMLRGHEGTTVRSMESRPQLNQLATPNKLNNYTSDEQTKLRKSSEQWCLNYHGTFSPASSICCWISIKFSCAQEITILCHDACQLGRPSKCQSICRSYRLCEETQADTMRPFSLDHALTSAAVPSRRNEFLTYFLETTVHGVHFSVDEDGKLPKSTISPHMLNAGCPRIVDGVREDHKIAGHLQNGEGWGSDDNAAMKILEGEGSRGSPSAMSEEEKKSTGGVEPGDVVSDGISHSQCLEFLCSRGPHFLMNNLKDKETICSVLLDMAEHVKVLPPGNEPLAWDVLSMCLWKVSLCELIKEMKTVEEKCSSVMENSGVYVLTTSRYSAFLRALAAEIADAAVKLKVDN